MGKIKEALLVETGQDILAMSDSLQNPKGSVIGEKGLKLTQVKHFLPETGFLRLPQIVGDKKAGIPAIIPVSKSTWWAGVKSGRYPQPVKLSERCTAWRVEDVLSLIEEMARD